MSQALLKNYIRLILEADHKWTKANKKNLNLDRPMSIGGWPEGEDDPKPEDQIYHYLKSLGMIEE
jgi:hypothetical protein|tara:strand:- start:291 stop:485 length:195 start_codon:yes stop_codon:yes gene_type:complete